MGTDLAYAVPLSAFAGLGHAHLDFVLLGSLLDKQHARENRANDVLRKPHSQVTLEIDPTQRSHIIGARFTFSF